MKFLVISKSKETASAAPPKVIRQLYESTFKQLKQAMKEGKIPEFYYAPGWGRAVSIQEHDSAEEVTKMIEGTPIAPYMNFEVYPLANFEESMKIFIESWKRLEKLMPG